MAFDLLTVLENKLQGIAAMEEYKLDCDPGTAYPDLLRRSTGFDVALRDG